MAKDKRDLTRIEDLSEYLHQEDDEVDRLLNVDLPPTPADLSSLPDDDNETVAEDLPPTPFDFAEAAEEVEESESFTSDFSLDQGDAFSFDSSSDEQSDEGEFKLEDSGPFELSEEATDDHFDSVAEDFSEYTDAGLVDLNQPTVDENATESSFSQPEVAIEASRVMATPSADYRPESLSDVKQYARNLSYGTMSQGGNPPFSVVLRHIKYQEDCEDILIILRDHGLVNESNQREMLQGLEQGSLLISQLSEYSAIYLAHRLRRFDLEIQVGLSDELHPSKSYGREADRPINKRVLHQNRQEEYSMHDQSIELGTIIISTLSSLPDRQIIRYLGVVTEHALVDEAQLAEIKFDQEESETSEVYDALSNRLKGKVLKKGGNALLGLNYQFQPIPEGFGTIGNKFKITCSGTAVFLSDRGA